MIQKSSKVYCADKSGVIIGNVFHIYKGGQKKIGRVGEFVKISVRKVKPDVKLKKKSKSKALISRTSYKSFKLDGSYFNFYENNVILLKRKLITRSKEFVQPADRNILRKKLIYKFTGIL